MSSGPDTLFLDRSRGGEEPQGFLNDEMANSALDGDAKFQTYGILHSNSSYGSGPIVPKINHLGGLQGSLTEAAPLLKHLSSKKGDKAAHTGWDELWVMCKYATPVLGTQLLGHSLAITSVVSIGHISTTALAASALGSMTAAVTGHSILQGLVSSLDALLPGSWTGPQPEMTGLWSQRMSIIMALALVPISCIWVNAEKLLLLLRQEAEVAQLAGVFLRWSLLSLPAYGFNCISRRYFQSQGLFSVPARIVMVAAPINALLNYLLVWGPMPIRLGFIGAPIASAISMNLLSLLYILYGVYFVPRTAWHPFSRRSFQRLGFVLKLGLAGVVQTASEWWSWDLVALAASWLGSVPLASQSVLFVTTTTSYQAFSAISTATSVRVGNLLGEGDGERASLAAKMSLFMTLGAAAVMSAIFLTFRHTWGFFFNGDPEVALLVAQILPLVALFQVFDGLAITMGGLLRTRGRQYTGAWLNLSAYYTIGIPLGLFLAFKLDMKLFGLWAGLTVALIYCAVVSIWLNFRADWDFEVQKVCSRIKKEQQLFAEGHNDV